MTLLLCGPFLLLPGEAASKVFLQLLLSIAMSIALANINPYIHPSDDILAQLCQGALSLTMTIGLLDMAAVEFQDSYYGPLLVICTTMQVVLGFAIAAFKWGLRKFPKTVEKLEGMVSIFCSNPGVDKGILEPQKLARSYTRIQKNVVAPLPASSTDTTNRIVSSSAEASWIVGDISTARGDISGPQRVAPLPASSADDDTTVRIVSPSEEASWIVEDDSTARGKISGSKCVAPLTDKIVSSSEVASWIVEDVSLTTECSGGHETR